MSGKYVKITEANASNICRFDHEVKQVDKTCKGGSRFYPVRFINNGQRRDGWFNYTTPFIITRGLVDPNDHVDKRNEFRGENPLSGSHLRFEVRANEAGALGKFMLALNEYWLQYAANALANGTIKAHSASAKNIIPVVRTIYGENHKTLAGQVNPNPSINLGLDYRKYPDNVPDEALRGKVRSEIQDFTRRNAAGLFEPACIQEKGVMVPVDALNAYKFLITGSTVYYISLNINSIVTSKMGISLSITLSKIVISSGGNIECGDEEFLREIAASTIPTNPSSTPSTSASATTDEDAAADALAELDIIE